MIIDNGIGLKMPENEDEEMWLEIKKTSEEDIKKMEKMLKFNRAVFELAETKLQQFKGTYIG
jgi:hypothetical protein